MPRNHSKPVQELLDTIEHKRLGVFFHPVIDLNNSSIAGYEEQIHGPSSSLLFSPLRLHRLAKQSGMLLELENLCFQLAMDRFVNLELQGILFLKLDGDVFLEHKFKEVRVAQAVEKSGIDPQRIVITLCMHDHADTENPNLLAKIISRYAELGYKVALEDQGESFSMLQSKSAIQPFCVKINHHLVRDIDKDPIRVQLIKSLQGIANNSGFITLAEGIETRGELLLAREMGISLGQGGFIAGPSKKPLKVTPREVKNLLAVNNENSLLHDVNSIEAILEKAPHFSLENNNEEVFRAFENNPQLSVVAVIHNGVPVGLINRSVFTNRYARPYQSDLHGKKRCSTFMDADPLIVDRNISIQELSRLLAKEPRHVSMGFIFTENGLYCGVGSGKNLINEITEMQIQSARHANPLSGLPGNAPINERIDALLKGDESFCICYFDLNDFKPFNDVYGFSMGDAMIQMSARIITAEIDLKADFVGHIGGDDFIVLFGSADWEARCRTILERFGVDVMTFFNPHDIERGGYDTENRKGEKEFHKLTSLSIGAVPVRPKSFKSHRDVAIVATESKKMAKKMHGNSLFINQRDYSKK